MNIELERQIRRRVAHQGLYALGFIRRVARGLYNRQEKHPLLGQVPTRPDEIAKSLAGRDATRVPPTGASAANALGLSDQVPMKVVYLTDGRTRHMQLGNLEIVLWHTAPRFMATAGRISGTVIQALRWLGRRNVVKRVIILLRRRLSDSDRRQLLDDFRYAPAWIADIMRQVASPQE